MTVPGGIALQAELDEVQSDASRREQLDALRQGQRQLEETEGRRGVIPGKCYSRWFCLGGVLI